MEIRRRVSKGLSPQEKGSPRPFTSGEGYPEAFYLRRRVARGLLPKEKGTPRPFTPGEE